MFKRLTCIKSRNLPEQMKNKIYKPGNQKLPGLYIIQVL